ncbi:formate transporter FocA [Pelagibaculum spongiae]|uniref:Formate transporter FocA n=1 Tax=Pelagibaculum spongiae TaxID=2080658 RepID=A0A2V1GY40_9GAMM|nr:formate transporter FocA [Pelagibaculum spongiae]PVZ65474.1 formate transporter FocA [Pelagibaculum spongiae]
MAAFMGTTNELLETANQYGLKKLANPVAVTLGLAASAGCFIGLGFVFYITVMTGSQTLPWGISHLLGGVVFSLGLVLVVICSGELFTSSVLSIVPYSRGLCRFFRLLQHWGLVYLGNMLGAFFLVILVMLGGLYQLDNGQWGATLLATAQHKIHHDFIQAVVLGMLCNLMVCLAVWMSFSSKDPLTKSALLIMPVALFISTGFEHCVANLFLLPVAYCLVQWAPESFWLATNLQAAQFADLTIANIVFSNLIPVTIGNILGGACMVGLGYQKLLGSTAASSATNNKITANGNTRL